jgi:hypothetical protein
MTVQQSNLQTSSGKYVEFDVLTAANMESSIFKYFQILIQIQILRVFENRVLRRIFGPKRNEVTGKWRKLHNEERRDLYSSPSII